MSDKALDSLLAQAAEKIRLEGYSAGWRDAIACAHNAVGNMLDSVPSENLETTDKSPAPSGGNSKLPKQGSTPWEIVQTVRKMPGLTSTQIVDSMKASGHSAPVTSIKTSIFRMKDKKLIIARHGKWYSA